MLSRLRASATPALLRATTARAAGLRPLSSSSSEHGHNCHGHSHEGGAVNELEYYEMDVTGQSDSQVCAVLGSQWGDEGKGKLVDRLCGVFDIVARFNGGNNAGHTIVINGKKNFFHLLPSGLAQPHTLNLLGNGVVVHLPGLFKELDGLSKNGIDYTGRFKISDRAHIVLDFHQEMDAHREQVSHTQNGRAGANIGTTKKGIGPTYTSKAMRGGLRIGDLVDFERFTTRYHSLADEFSHVIPESVTPEKRAAELKQIAAFRDRIIQGDMICDTALVVNTALDQGKRVLAEGANAVMLDMDHGTYPYVTSSSTSAGGVCTGLGIPPNRVECTLGVVKAYTTRVGGGPFPTELTDAECGGQFPTGAPGSEIGKHLQIVGGEIGVTTGRKRRCGWLDLVVVAYSHMINGYASINLTKLDVLTGLDEVKLGIQYELDGKLLPRGRFPAQLDDVSRVKVIYKTLPGWKEDISKCKTFAELPKACREYVEEIENIVGVPVTWIGVGPDRNDMVMKPN